MKAYGHGIFVKRLFGIVLNERWDSKIISSIVMLVDIFINYSPNNTEWNPIVDGHRILNLFGFIKGYSHFNLN